jgi:hypothetical protein
VRRSALRVLDQQIDVRGCLASTQTFRNTFTRYDFIAYSSKMPYFPAHVSHNARDLITRLLCRSSCVCDCVGAAAPLCRVLRFLPSMIRAIMLLRLILDYIIELTCLSRDVNLRLGSGVEGAEAIKIHPCVS